MSTEGVYSRDTGRGNSRPESREFNMSLGNGSPSPRRLFFVRRLPANRAALARAGGACALIRALERSGGPRAAIHGARASVFEIAASSPCTGGVGYDADSDGACAHSLVPRLLGAPWLCVLCRLLVPW